MQCLFVSTERNCAMLERIIEKFNLEDGEGSERKTSSQKDLK